MKVERLYVIFNDDWHDYLIDYEYYNAFEDGYGTICDLRRSNDIDGDVFNDMLDNLLDLYSAKRLEGQEYYVVLPQDVKDEL